MHFATEIDRKLRFEPFLGLFGSFMAQMIFFENCARIFSKLIEGQLVAKNQKFPMLGNIRIILPDRRLIEKILQP